MSISGPGSTQNSIATGLRRLVLAGYLLGTLGAAVELALIRHTQGFWQWMPLLLIGLSLVVLAALWIVRSPAIVAVFRSTMVLFVLSGLIGLYLHFQANLEWVEEEPSLTGWRLIWQALIRGKNPPALAPGAMLQFGLLGWAYTYRYPVSGKIGEATALENPA